MHWFITSLDSLLATLAFLKSILPTDLSDLLFSDLFDCISRHFSPYCYIEIPEFTEGFNYNPLYKDIQLYLSNSPVISTASRLSLSCSSAGSHLSFTPAKNHPLQDSFRGYAATWTHVIIPPTQNVVSWNAPEEKRKFLLRIRKKEKPLFLGPYLEEIRTVAEGVRKRRKTLFLYTNSGGGSNDDHDWDYVEFKNPSCFDTLAMDPALKDEIKRDLEGFVEGKEFFNRTGRAWKRGYLLYGPPGTGKSSMIAAMANFLGYDIYDIELTQVKDNSKLKKLLMNTSSKSIIVIEDIDCTIDLQNRALEEPKQEPVKGPPAVKKPEKEDASKVTLSGLLNFTDGLWSSCEGERIFVFTTNHVEKLDPALVRSGRMDRHIYMGYCTCPAVRILMRNYLGLEDGDPVFGGDGMREVERLVVEEGAEVTPADVSEVLIKNRWSVERAVEELVELVRGKVEGKRKEVTEVIK